MRLRFAVHVPVRLLAGLVLLLLAHRPVAAQPGTLTLSGHVTGSAGGPAAGVTITVTGESSSIPPLATDATGGFTVAGLAPGLYTVTPARAGFVHAPASRTVTLLDGDAVVDFTEAVVSHTMAGRVVDANGTPLGGVAIALGGPASSTTTTDAAGRFAFFNVAPGGPLTVTPSLAGFSFAPASHHTQTLGADLEVPLFTAASGRFQRFLAEGVTNGFFDTHIALLNPTTLPTVARLTFQTSTGRVVAHDVALAGPSRVTIDPRAVGVGDADFSTVVEATQPLVVDRTVRWDPSGYGSHAESSVASAQTTWYFAEGATTGSFNLFYLLQNPGTQAASVSIRYLRPTPLAPIVKSYTIAPASRRTIYVNQEDPALDEAEISAVITSQNGVPIIAERAMYANVAGQVFGAGHGSAGLPTPSAQWFLAEGATGPFFNLFILVANPTTTPAPIEVRYLLTDGRVITRPHTVAAESRLTIGVHGEHPDLANATMSAIVTSTRGVPVLVERAMWWPANAPAWYEAHASAGATATGISWATADGEVGGAAGSETFLLIANTASYAGSARVTLVFEDGGSASRTVALLPSSRRTVVVGTEFSEAAGRRFGAIVESLGSLPAPIVVERAMYSNAGGVVWAAGSNLVATRLADRPATPVILAPPPQAGVIAPPVTVAGILGGDPESPARQAIPDVIAEDSTPPAEVSADPQGLRIVRTKIEIGFARTATAAQVNSVLDAIGGRIVNAIAGVPFVTVRIPNPGSLVALEASMARTRAMPAVITVSMVLVREEEALPGTHTPSSLGLATIDHLIAARAPAAWNVAAALNQPSQPLLVVEDYFGAGPPNAAVDVGMVASDFSNDGLQNHGYHVLATILGTFASVPSLTAGPNEVVGLFPRRVDARIVDVQATALPDGTAVENAVLRMVRDLPRRVVLNSSTGLEAPLSTAAIAPLAISWITKVRTAGPDGTSLEGKFLHVKAAGNDSSVLAALASESGAAALLANLVDGTGTPVSNITNTLLVENVLNTASEPFEPGCRRATSNVGGHIAAIGHAVFSLMDAGLTAGNKNGTSMATPQVAALAIYLWTLAPSLTPPQVMARLRRTARPGVAQTDPLCSTIASATAPAIDAYAAVLSADQGLAAPLVRRTLLDVVDAAGRATPDGTFDEHDLQRFLDEIDTRAGANFDYSRYDLNGDGRTGGDTLSRFDLDANVLPAWTSVTFPIAGTSVTYDETRLSDVRILCFYAFSSLFVGDEGVRDAVLDGRCIPATVTVTPSTMTLVPGGTQQFSAVVTGVADQAVTWSATGGTISATGLFTAPMTAGTVRVRATSVVTPAFGEAVVTVIVPTGRITAFNHATWIGTCASADAQVLTAGFANPAMTISIQGPGALLNQTLISTTTFTTVRANNNSAGEIVVTATSVESPSVRATASFLIDPFVAAYGGGSGGSAFLVRGVDAGLPDDAYRLALNLSQSTSGIFTISGSGSAKTGTATNGNSVTVTLSSNAMQGTVTTPTGATQGFELGRNCAPLPR